MASPPYYRALRLADDHRFWRIFALVRHCHRRHRQGLHLAWRAVAGLERRLRHSLRHVVDLFWRTLPFRADQPARRLWVELRAFIYLCLGPRRTSRKSVEWGKRGE